MQGNRFHVAPHERKFPIYITSSFLWADISITGYAVLGCKTFMLVLKLFALKDFIVT